MDTETIATVWETIREYIPAKERQAAADHLVEILIDSGVDDEALSELMGCDKYFHKAGSEHIEEDEEDDDNEDDWE